MRGRFLFIGVTTSQSQIMGLFPRWMEALGLDAAIEGRDLPLDGEPEVYRRVVAEIRDDPGIVGGLVTTHKVAVIDHARSFFRELDRWARLLGEVSSISKREGGLVGHATDPISSGLALDAIVPRSYWREHPEAGVLCLGAGGSGAAITAHLLTLEERPARIAITGRRPARLDAVRTMVAQLGGDELVSYHAVAGEGDSDALVTGMGPGSLIINATGAGKDRPGSPISGAARFPPDAIAWDFNYRGELRFLAQARAQIPSERIHDGWRYFIHGWTQVIGEVFGIEMTPQRLASLEAAAERQGPPRGQV